MAAAHVTPSKSSLENLIGLRGHGKKSQLTDLLSRAWNPAPWSEGDNIPWHDPEFSTRMLLEHLDQSHDLASRRFEKIDAHVNWIHRKLLLCRADGVLDLGCGPGLYANRLAELGHQCVGIDYSPASIAYAQEQALELELRCRYIHEDIRSAEYGSDFAIAMLIYGEFNVFKPSDALTILAKAWDALRADGVLLLEAHTYATVRDVGLASPTWRLLPEGLFSNAPHLYLQENAWDEEVAAATTRYLIVDAASGEVTRFAQSFQAYTETQYRSVLENAGFKGVHFLPSLTGSREDAHPGLMVITAHK